MSGTSLDGIDVAIVDIRRAPVRIRSIGFLSTPYSKSTRAAILAVSGASGGSTREISRLNFHLGELYARAILRAVRRFGPVELIGCHGQTIYHQGGKHTLQIGAGAVIAERVGVPVVSNFRARDIAAGGQGAPLVPYVDALLFRHPRRTRVALNIGGIANITVIPAGTAPEDVTAFDTGPGNMAIDALAREYSRGKLNCDRGGKIAASGRVDKALLDGLLADPYYRRRPPKSAGREQYGAEFVARIAESGLPPRDQIATATALTAATIAFGVRRALPHGPFDLIVSGGGSHNPAIMGMLAGFLPGAALSTSTDHGIDADGKEAIAFAILAHATWFREPANLPSATGADQAVILGDLTP
jgi:anhydro-N-acetylmuramic acid kinase